MSSTDRSTDTGDSQPGQRSRAKASRKMNRRRRSRDAVYASKAKGQMRGVVGNVTLTRNEVVAWFVQEPQSLSFKPNGDVEEMMSSAASTLSELTGHRVFWRVTTRPYAVRQFAEATHEDMIEHGDPLPGWDDMLAREQHRMLGSSLADKWVYIGVRVSTSRRYPGDARMEVRGLRDTIDDITDKVAAYGLEARPAHRVDMEWLLRRSVGLGLPAPNVESGLIGDYETDDLPELWEHARWGVEPWGKTIKVTGTAPSGIEVTRHVAVLTMGRIEPQNVPQDGQGGWMQRTDRLSFPVEWMATVELLPNDRVRGKLRHQMDMIRDQWAHYVEDHKIDPPESLKRQREMALETEDEVEQGLGGLATRSEGWYRLAVWGDTEEDALKNVRAVKRLYGRHVAWWHSWDQYKLGREFIPGEPLANTAARRRLSVTALAAALPAATAEIGDKFGCVMGWTSGTSKRVVVWHPWLDMERFDRSGVMIVGGDLGSGKSVAAGSIVYRTVMPGATWTVLDPSGRLGALCDLPELKEHSRYVDLLKGRSGELNPYRVVAEPRREHYTTDAQGNELSAEDAEAAWRQAQEEAAAMRSSLCKDILTAMLPEAIRSTAKAVSVMTRAVAQVKATNMASPNNVLSVLHRIADADLEKDLTAEYRIVARDIHTELENIAATPKGRLVFPAGFQNDYRDLHMHGSAHPPAGADLPDDDAPPPRLTVYSLHGLNIPRADEKVDDTPDGRMSLVLFNLAAWLTQRAIYDGDPNERKGLLIDEGHALAYISSGRSLIQKSGTDSRKHNTRVIFASQNVRHWNLGDIGNLIGAALIGRTTDDDAAAAALNVLKVKDDAPYIRILKALSKTSRRGATERPPARGEDSIGNPTSRQRAKPKFREFIFSTGESAERIVYDMHAHPHVLAALDTTPGSRTAALNLADHDVDESENEAVES